jgi:beta-glucanase (GH16 family)
MASPKKRASKNKKRYSSKTIHRLALIAVVLGIAILGITSMLLSRAATDCANTAPCVTNGADITSKSWRLDFSDEFNGSSLDTTKWVSLRGGAGPSGFGYHTYVGNPYNNNENAFYKSANTTVTGGSLTLTLKPESNNGYPYSTGMVQSGPYYSYSAGSYIEARINVPSCDGCWPAFWSLQAPTESVWPPEFDIFEFFNTSSWHWPNFQYHWPPDNMLKPDGTTSNNIYGSLSSDYTRNYHIYGMYWDGAKAVPYLDGIAYPTAAATSNMTTANMYLIMSMQLGKGFAPAGENKMLVDWIRVWKPNASTPTPAPAPTPPAPTPTTPSPTPSTPTPLPSTPVPTSPITTTTSGQTVTTLVTSGSTSTQVVSGTVITPDKSNTGSTEKITKIDGATVSSGNKLDTTYLTNGEHIVTVATTTKDGKTIHKTIKINVANKLNPFEKARNYLFAPFHGNQGLIDNSLIATAVLVGLGVSYFTLSAISRLSLRFVH